MTQTTSRTAPGRLDSWIDTYDRDGLVLIDGLLPPEKVNEASRGVDWAMSNIGGNYKWIKQRTYEWFREHPIFVELIEHPLVLDFARSILGDDFHLIAAQCSRNTRDDHYAPGVNQIHQDAGLFPPQDRRVGDLPDHHYGFSAMWYLQDTPLEMGPTELLRGSHADGGRKHSNTEIEQDSSTLFRRAIAAGSLLIFSHYTWHRGANNTTERPRDLITNAYARPQVPKGEHVSIKGEDGVERFSPPTDVMSMLSAGMKRLLRP